MTTNILKMFCAFLPFLGLANLCMIWAFLREVELRQGWLGEGGDGVGFSLNERVEFPVKI